MSHLPDRTKREHGKAQDGRISSNMANTAFLKDDILLHTAGFLDWHSLHSLSSASRGLRFLAEHANYTFFKGFFREVITVPGMSYFLRIAKDNAKLQAALLKAARRLETMHISIDYSSEREGKRSLTIVKKFLTTCFAGAVNSTAHCANAYQTIVIITLYPNWPPNQAFDPSMQLIPIAFEELARDISNGTAVATQNGETSPPCSLKLNLEIPSSSPFEWDPILEHVQGAIVTMETCRSFKDAVVSTARFLTVHMGAHECNVDSFKIVGRIFLHVRDLRLHITSPHGKELEAGLSQCFGHVTTLFLELPRLGLLDLSNLSHLHTLSIRSDDYSELDLKLPANIESLAIVDLDGQPTLSLTSNLSKHLHKLMQLKRIEIRNCELWYPKGAVLKFFPEALTSLDLRGCWINPVCALGTPHHKLRELHIGYLSEDAALTSELHLRALSCVWRVLSNHHHSHLRVLWIDCIERQTGTVASFKDLSSLMDLWVAIEVFEETAISHLMDKDSVLKVLPSSLELLVLLGNERRLKNGDPWQLSPMKRLRSLGLCATELKVTRESLPLFLHTLAVDEEHLETARDILSEGEPMMTRLTTIDMRDWYRGPISGRFLSSHPKNETSASLDDLQARQRKSDARHHHQS